MGFIVTFSYVLIMYFDHIHPLWYPFLSHIFTLTSNNFPRTC
jgi:hypothetical protein